MNFKKNILRLCTGMVALMLLFVACTKNGNPNNLPESVPEAEYTGQTGTDVIKVLAVGNSFSEDAIEAHLYNLAKADGKKIIIGNLYIGGASLELHVKNANSNASIYEYRKVDTAGVRRNYTKASIVTALADEKWDYISFQQVSQNSGQYNTFEASLPTLYNYVKAHSNNANTKYILHQTWAYAQNSTHDGFANYNKSQATMYSAIVDAYSRAKTLIGASMIVPAGTAIQNARTSVVGDNFCRDGYHLTIPMGRYVAACTWYESIFGKNVVGNAYKPIELSDFEKSICQNAAHLAHQKPDGVTEMVAFQGDGNFTGSIFVNFGLAAAPTGWNGVTSFNAGTSVALKNNTNNYTGIGLTITERFNAENTAGETGTTTDFNMSNAVSSTSFFGNSKGAFNGIIVAQSKVKITGLNKDLKYNFCYFGSRSASSDNRETKFTTTGANESVVRVNTSNNKTQVVCAENITPTAAGEVVITVTSGENNNNSSGFYYLNAMRITKGQ
ncbi:DUF4886 domain-containing protein [Niabella hibiscisoli]|uniref:DUF4886 domain-containing protein n=1 Tax=Niabella hibiscisoli TaxID=1825928 RepID=UPI001F0FABA6|nr:DUF4886 domain-containing protein [Niabella hibiscisoli]MCH5716576.1 DUF4886 domain-containing protein [Niabella hibiscisoli]